MVGGVSKQTFFGRFAMPIACVVCLLFPLALRGAWISVQNMKNAVADWLPARFEETAQMQWFWRHFVGDRYIVASWEGCTGNDNDLIYQRLLKKLRAPLPPSRRPPEAHEGVAGASAKPDSSTTERSAEPTPPAGFGIRVARDYEFIGDQLGLSPDGNWHEGFGGRREKWVRAIDQQWYFITPDGRLFRWTSAKSPWGRLIAYCWRKLVGADVDGVQVAEFGPADGPWYFADPNRLAAQLFQQVTTGPQIVRALTADDDAALPGNEAVARKRMAGILLGPDGQQSCVVLTLSDVGRRDLHAVIGRPVMGREPGKLYALAQACGLPSDQLHLGGPPVDNVAIDEEGTVTLLRLTTLSGLLGVALSYTCFRSIRATLIVFIVGGVSAVCSLAVVGWFGSLLDAVLMAMPALVFVLAISGAVHLMNYYRGALDTHGATGAVETAIAQGWGPALLCNITTAVGLFSLMTSDLTPIRKFGFFSGLAVMATVVLLFSLLPAALQLFPLKPHLAAAPPNGRRPPGHDGELWTVVGNFMIGRHVLVSATCMVVIVIVGWGSRYLLTSINLLDMFDANAKIIQDYDWLEQKLGKLVPLEVVVRIPYELQQSMAGQPRQAGPDTARNRLSFLDRMILVDGIQSVVQRELGPRTRQLVGASMSAATMALPISSEFRSFAGRVATNTRLLHNRPALLESDYLTLDEQQAELWRISFRIGAGADTDYGQIVTQVKRVIEPVLMAYRIKDQLFRSLPPVQDAPTSPRVLFLRSQLAPVEWARRQPPVAAPSVHTDALINAGRQSDILASTLYNILKLSRVRVEVRPANPKAAADDEATFAGFNAVVLLGESSPAEQTKVSLPRGVMLIDARAGAIQDESASGGGQPNESGSLRAIYTGIIPVVTKAQQTLLTSLITSTFWSFVTITPLMIFVCRSLPGGLVVMLPNVLPVFVVFGAMGWLGMPVDIGSMMSASIALGVAVDDTIHFLSWFRVALNELGDRKLAILSAYRHCATPTLQAALISGLGLSIFSFSTFIPIKRFGFLMLAILFAGVAAELIFLPALLAGPLGSVFQPPSKSRRARELSSEKGASA